MLSIPDSVKTLFKTDGVRKNFRVHFPNGEYSDITNENVVQESVKFTESLCSQDVFKFGLAEASVLEFESVGIGNMYGMTIEASIEIDTSSLTALQVTDIQSGTWDGTLTPNENLLSFADKAATNFSGVTVSISDEVMTFSGTRTGSGTSSFMPTFTSRAEPGRTYKLSVTGTIPTNVQWAIYAVAGSTTALAYLTSGNPSAVVTTPVGMTKMLLQVNMSGNSAMNGNVTVQIEPLFFSVPLGVFRVESCPRNHGAMTHRQVTAYSVTKGDSFISPYVDWKYNKSWNASPTKTYASMEDFVNSNLGWADPSIVAQYTKTQIAYPGSTSQYNVTITFPSEASYIRDGSWINYYPVIAQVTTDSLFSIDLDEAVDVDAIASTIEGYVGGTYSDSDKATLARFIRPALATILSPNYQKNFMWSITGDVPIVYASPTDNFILYVPQSIVIQYHAPGSPGTIYEKVITLTSGNPVTAYKLTPLSASPIPLSVSSMGSKWIYSPNMNVYFFTDTLDIPSLVTGLTEAVGEFIRVSRNGGVEVMALDPNTVISVSPGEYEEMWWDEYNVSPIGSVTVSYKTEDGTEMTEDISICDGASVYDMTQNEALKNAGISSANLATFLAGSFATNAANVGFTPTDLTMQGFPWMEAGDALEITAEDGTVVDTYALRIEMMGIQKLTSVIESKGGEIIGEA